MMKMIMMMMKMIMMMVKIGDVIMVKSQLQIVAQWIAVAAGQVFKCHSCVFVFVFVFVFVHTMGLLVSLHPNLLFSQFQPQIYVFAFSQGPSQLT